MQPYTFKGLIESGKRPIPVVEPPKCHAIENKVLPDALRGNVAVWWIAGPVIQVDHMPLWTTGKVDKNRLRAEYAKT